MAKHACPIPGCTEYVHDDLLMCSPHWLATPASLRRDVKRTWRALVRARALTPAEFLAARRVHLQACNAAVDTVARSELPVCA